MDLNWQMMILCWVFSHLFAIFFIKEQQFDIRLSKTTPFNTTFYIIAKQLLLFFNLVYFFMKVRHLLKKFVVSERQSKFLETNRTNYYCSRHWEHLSNVLGMCLKTARRLVFLEPDRIAHKIICQSILQI